MLRRAEPPRAHDPHSGREVAGPGTCQPRRKATAQAAKWKQRGCRVQPSRLGVRTSSHRKCRTLTGFQLEQSVKDDVNKKARNTAGKPTARVMRE